MTFTAIYGTNGVPLEGIDAACIGINTFTDCPRLSGNITIPNGVTYIGESAFRNTAISSVSFPSSLTQINVFAFYNSGITSLTLPSSLTTIGGMAFGFCSELTGIITLPESLTAIVGGAFYNCYKVLSINIPSSTNICSFEDYPNYDIMTFFGVNNINYPRNINVDNWSINDGWVFGARTFNGHIEDGLVYRDQSKTKVTGCDYQQSSFTLPATVDTIGMSAFNRDENLTQITLPEGVEVIGQYSFSSCSGLSQIIIPSTVSTIDYNAFSSCTGLTDVTLPAALTYLGVDAFVGCDNLDTLRMLGSVPPMYETNEGWWSNIDQTTGDTLWVYDTTLVNVPIVVPCHAGYAYRHAEGWSMCNNIIDPCGDEVVYYTVTVNSADPTMGSVSEGGEVEEGDSFTFRATANDGYHFLRWNDGDTNAERTVVVTSDTTFTAYFEADGGTEGIGGIEAVNAKVYAEHGRIVVEGVEGETVSVFDVAGRQVKNSDLHAGVYMVKIGSAPARKVVVTR